jgi:dipeptidyl aminopeptidase/acylaminoacyl peptidase
MSISITDLFRIPLLYSFDLASDGKTVLYSSNQTGIPHLYIQQAQPNSKSKQLTCGDDPILFGFLSPSADQIAYLQDKDGNQLYHVLVMAKDGKETRQITKEPCRTWDVAWHPRGKEIARSYATKKSCGIEILNAKTHESFVLKDQQAPCFNVAYSHDGKWIASTEYGGGKDPKNMQVVTVNRNDPAEAINYKFKDGSKEQLLSWAPDDKRLAFLSDAKGKNQVVIQDFQGEEQLFLDLKEGEEVSDTAEVGWNPSGNKVYYIVGKHSQTSLCEHALDGKRTTLPFPKGTILRFKISENGKIAAGHSSMSSPYNIYLYEAGYYTAKPLISLKYKADLTKLAKPESLWYKSFDGLKIHAWYLPARSGKPPHSAVVLPHGGPWWQTFDRWDPLLQSISQSGFAVLAPNYRGSSGYGVEFRNLDLSDPGGGDLEDIAAGAKWLAKQSEIDESRIAIIGASYGGYLTLIALTKKPNAFAAGVALVPITDWLATYELDDATFRSIDEELFGGSPEKKKELYRDRSPITHVSKIKAPVMISCGRNDPNCPIQPVEKFVKKLREMHHPHEFRVEEKEGHGFARTEAAIRDAKTSIEYLKKTLKVGRN